MRNAFAALAGRWREDAGVLRRCGHDATADLCETHAAELEAAWEDFLAEPLPIREAAEESGYSESRLYRLVERGAIPNAGHEGRPRIRRRDLPRKVATSLRKDGSEDRVMMVDKALEHWRGGS